MTEQKKVIPEDYYNLFVRNELGVKILEDMKLAHHGYSSEFHTDSREHARQSGERNVVLRIEIILEMYRREKSDG